MRRVPAVAAWFVFWGSGLALSQTAAAPSAASSQVLFQFERPGLQVPKFSLNVDDAGSAVYEADEVTVVKGGPEQAPMQHVLRKVTLSRPGTERIFGAARDLDHFKVECASKMKNIADTGTKTLRYTGEDGDGSCTYNFSENKRVVQLTDLFLGIARTLDVGRRLDFQHRFDRLGLDATMSSLMEEVDGGRAAEVGIIAPTLRSLTEDTEVMQRVRERAARLLQATEKPAS